MANVTRLKSEISDLNRRKGELIAEREPAAAAYSKAVQDVIASNAGASSIEPFKATISTFDSLISDIESLIAIKESELSRDVVIERRATLIREAKTLAERAKAAGIKCAEAVIEFSTNGNNAIDKFIFHRNIIGECRTRFRQIVNLLVPRAAAANIYHLPDVDKQLQDLWIELDSLADFSVLRNNCVFSIYGDRLIDVEHNAFNLPKAVLPQTWQIAVRERESLLYEEKRLKEALSAENNPPAKKRGRHLLRHILNSNSIF